jgi:hypothetical protein
MPIIFASSLMIFPSVVFSAVADGARASGSTGWYVGLTNWLATNFQTGAYLYVMLYVAMVYFFSYFWITVQFNPEDMSKQLRDHGSFIPGLRPGPRTAEYLEAVMERITYVGAAFLAVIAVLPLVVNQWLQVDFVVTQFLGGTGLLIVVSVALDFLQRVEATLLMRNYEGFLGVNSQIAGSWEPARALCPGDLVTADLAVRLGDWHADAAVSWTVPGPTPSDRARLAVASRQVTRAALEACAPGQPWAEVVRAIHAAAAAEAVHLLPGFFAHGIGRALHQPPSLPLHRRDLHRLDHPGLTLERGMIITLEPVVSLARTVRVREGWLDRTADGSDACYTEVTAVIGRRKARVLAGKILMPDRT